MITHLKGYWLCHVKITVIACFLRAYYTKPFSFLFWTFLILNKNILQKGKERKDNQHLYIHLLHKHHRLYNQTKAKGQTKHISFRLQKELGWKLAFYTKSLMQGVVPKLLSIKMKNRKSCMYPGSFVRRIKINMKNYTWCQ